MSVDLAPAPQQSGQEYTKELIIAARETVADGVVALTLADPAGGQLPEWDPGAHVELDLPSIGVTRQYSLCGRTDRRDSWRIAVLNTPNSRGGSRFVHTRLRPGALIGVRGPRNHFPFLHSRRYLFIAGGIGITPILPMIRAAEAAGADW